MIWDSNTPPSRPGLDIWSVKFAGLDICEWPNNNHIISSDTILELSRPNSTPKASSWGEGCPIIYEGYLCHILKRCGTLTDSRHKHATDMSGPRFLHIYGLVQCTPDLSAQQREYCLGKTISKIPMCCNNKKGSRILKPSCSLDMKPTASMDLP